jgi:hypothetical protein
LKKTIHKILSPYLVLKRCFLFAGVGGLLGGRTGADAGKVGDDLLGVLRLTRSRLTRNQDRLVLRLCKYVETIIFTRTLSTGVVQKQ